MFRFIEWAMFLAEELPFLLEDIAERNAAIADGSYFEEQDDGYAGDSGDVNPKEWG
jgi:hypothetical protein